METINRIQQTKHFAEKVASGLNPGDTVGFVGGLGAGKTTIIQFIAKKLGVDKKITSPTYLYVKTYPLQNNITLVHCDAYRLKNRADFNSVDLSQYLGSRDTIVLIEWADKITDYLPTGTAIYTINFIDDRRAVTKQII